MYSTFLAFPMEPKEVGPLFSPRQRVMVNQGTGKYVKGRNVSPYWATYVKSEGDKSWVVKDSTKRTCVVPTWSLLSPSQWEMLPITPDSRPSFRKMSTRSKAKIMEGANASLRGKILENSKDAKRLERRYDESMKREKARAARIIGKLKAKMEQDLRTATLVGEASANYWRKRALVSEKRANHALQNVKRLKVQVKTLKENAAGLADEADNAKGKLLVERQRKREVTRRLKQQQKKLSDSRLTLRETRLECEGLVAEIEEMKGGEESVGKCIQIRAGGKGNPMTPEFELLSRSCMATGLSATSCLQTLRLAAEFFVGVDEISKWNWPKERWFQLQREAAGNISWLLVMVEVAGAKRILQHGCDETGISGLGTFSQWVLLEDIDGLVKMRVLECAGLLPGSSAEEITSHVKSTWSRGREAVELLRDRLGNRADDLVPVRTGGIRLMRLEAFMGDGCNTAKAVMRQLGEAKNEDGKEFYGEEGWEAMDEEIKSFVIDICANHTRNYPVDEFNGLFSDMLHDSIGDEFNECAQKMGGRSRLEKEGPPFLRSVCKLAYSGLGEYEKGDGKDIKLWLEDNYPNFVLRSVGRVELSKRQDWVLEVSSKIYPLLGPLHEYLVSRLPEGPNVLRDSTLQRMELRYFNAYVHVCALMWEVAFAELRFLTNSKKVALNPCEVYDLYDRLWDMGSLLQKSDDCLDVFEDTYRPWPVVHPDDEHLQKWYERKADNHAIQMEKLRNYNEFEDYEAYVEILRHILCLFGDAIHESFQRNIGEWLERTKGSQSNSQLSVSDREKKEGILCHNNHAERTFAVFRSVLSRFPSMKMRHAASLSFSRLNGTYKLGENGVGQGLVHAAPKELMGVVSELCSVRQAKVGDVTKMLRRHHDIDFVSARETRRRKNKEKEAAAIVKARRKANEKNKAASVVLINSVASLRLKLAACNGAVTTSRVLLQEQIRTRFQLGRTYPISAVGHEYRGAKKPYKIRWTKPRDDARTEVDYLTDLAMALIEFELDNGVVMEQPVEDLVRTVPEISSAHTSAKGKQLRTDLNVNIATAAEPQDDTLAVELLHAYKGKLLFVNDDAAWPSQTFRVVDVQFYQGKGAYHDSWEATCEPVEMSKEGSWRVPSKYLVPGGDPPVVMNRYLYGVELASLEDHENPKRMPFVDEYIALHEGRVVSRK